MLRYHLRRLGSLFPLQGVPFLHSRRNALQWRGGGALRETRAARSAQRGEGRTTRTTDSTEERATRQASPTTLMHPHWQEYHIQLRRQVQMVVASPRSLLPPASVCAAAAQSADNRPARRQQASAPHLQNHSLAQPLSLIELIGLGVRVWCGVCARGARAYLQQRRLPRPPRCAHPPPHLHHSSYSLVHHCSPALLRVSAA
jgi:hypothetical protein